MGGTVLFNLFLKGEFILGERKTFLICYVAPCSEFDTRFWIGIEDYFEKKGMPFEKRDFSDGAEAAKFINNQRVNFLIVNENTPNYRVLLGTLRQIKKEKDEESGAESILTFTPGKNFAQSLFQRINCRLACKIFVIRSSRR